MTPREEQILHWIEADPLISQQELAQRAGITRSSVAVHISNLMKKGYIAGKGYIVRNDPYVTVVGAVNLDIGGWPGEALVPQDSNPGVVRTSLGGVGRNIAHNLALLGADSRLLTVFGDDDNGRKIIDQCRAVGIDVSPSPLIPGGRTSTYLFINDQRGDMALAVSDMDIYRHLSPQLIHSRQSLLDGSQVVVMDANAPQETLIALAESVRAPLFADPTSTAKAIKLKPILGRLHTLKPNLIEAQLLSGVNITDEASLHRAADTLLATGLQRVFISLGSRGILAADREQHLYLPNFPVQLRSATGCGDAFIAALVWAYQRDFSLGDAAKAGLAAAAITAESEETNSPALNAQALLSRMESANPQN